MPFLSLHVRRCVVLVLLALPGALAAQSRDARGPAMPTGRRSLHVDLAVGQQHLRMRRCVGCPDEREDFTAHAALALPATRRLLVGARASYGGQAFTLLSPGPLVRGSGTHVFARWWPPGTGPFFVQGALGHMRYRYARLGTALPDDPSGLRLRGPQLGAGGGMLVPLAGNTLAMTTFAEWWRVPRAVGTLRTQAVGDEPYATVMSGWQVVVALTVRVP